MPFAASPRLRIHVDGCEIGAGGLGGRAFGPAFRYRQPVLAGGIGLLHHHQDIAALEQGAGTLAAEIDRPCDHIEGGGKTARGAQGAGEIERDVGAFGVHAPGDLEIGDRRFGIMGAGKGAGPVDIKLDAHRLIGRREIGERLAEGGVGPLRVAGHDPGIADLAVDFGQQDVDSILALIGKGHALTEPDAPGHLVEPVGGKLVLLHLDEAERKAMFGRQGATLGLPCKAHVDGACGIGLDESKAFAILLGLANRLGRQAGRGARGGGPKIAKPRSRRVKALACPVPGYRKLRQRRLLASGESGKKEQGGEGDGFHDRQDGHRSPATGKGQVLMPALFVFGYGYSAEVLGRRLMARGWQVAGTCRDAGKAARLGQDGCTPFLFDGTAPLTHEGRAWLARASHLLVSIPPGEAGDPALVRHGEDIAAAPDLAWIGYLSTTGVYGDHGGAEVDENTVPTPRTDRARRRLAAERAWLELGARTGKAVHVFRLAGIYGPGRNPFVALREGRARRIDLPEHLSSRIHVEDIARVLAASMAHPRGGAMYNVCDDEPASPAAVTEFAARLAGLDVPPLQSPDEAGLSPMARSFYEENRRVSNRRIRDELGVRLDFPDYRVGLGALLETDGR